MVPLQVFRKSFVNAEFTASTSKKFYLATGNGAKTDSLYSIMLEALYQRQGDIDYTHEFFVDGNVVATQPANVYEFKPNGVGTCYDFHVRVSGDDVLPSTSPTQTVCVQPGINATVKFEHGQTLGRTSTFKLNVYETDPAGCLALDISEDQVYIFHDVTVTSPLNVCQTRGKSFPGKNIDYVSMATIPSEAEVSRVYQNASDFTIVLVAINDAHHQEEEFVLSVTETQCSSPDVELLGRKKSPYKFHSSHK